MNLATAIGWDDLNAAEELNLDFAGAVPIEQVLKSHRWLRICETVAQQQGFFHWGLDFATVFARGGFDLQVGNPPWVRPETDLDALLAEGDPWWQLALKPSEAARSAKRNVTLALPGIRDLVVSATADLVVTGEYLGSAQTYPILAGLRPDLYRCFMEQTWKNASNDGVVALIHPETHFTDNKAAILREHAYLRLRRHWQFLNKLMLYDISHQKRYGVHVYGRPAAEVRFIMASSLFHPDTVERSLKHDGSGEQPGIKDPEGNWDLRPHRERIIGVTDSVLKVWRAIMEDDGVPARQTQMVYTVNKAVADVLTTLSLRPRASSLGLEFSAGWNETTDRKKGYFELRWGVPDSWCNVILQGPHLYVATPMYKSVNRTMKNQADWSMTDFERLPSNAIPVTAYKPIGSREKYDADYTQWSYGSARSFYRIAWRNMAANNGERTLIPAVIPPGAAHVDGIFAAGLSNPESLCVTLGFLGSLLVDFGVRAAPKSTIRMSTANRLPVMIDHPLQKTLLLRVLRLNCVTDAYADLWSTVFQEAFIADRWTGGLARANRPDLGAVFAEWTAKAPLRISEDRRQALIEIDALVALMLGVAPDQLCTVYRTQFPVLYDYDHWDYVYDANGRLVPNSVLTVWRSKGDQMTSAERTATNQAGHTYIYESPFRLLDRESDMRTAYAEFERRLAAHE
jgi:hypothetical protein